MAWRCASCSRYWGRCRKACPLCNARMVARMLLRRKLPAATAIELIHDFAGLKGRVHVLPKGPLCSLGTARSCRCNFRCRRPTDRCGDDFIFDRLARNCGRGRAVAARWVHVLSGAVARQGDHGVLHGMFITANCGRGAHVELFRRTQIPRILSAEVPLWVWRWFIALFSQYTRDRPDLRSLIGTAASVFFPIDS